MSWRTREQGATALFLVIFATVLLSVITIGFAQMMTSEQSNSLNNVLSQSAYDSATAGVEDAKRTILACQGGVVAACNAIAANGCYTNGAVTGVTSGETFIQSSSGAGADLDQAYTCVKIDMNNPDYIRPLALGVPLMIPLKATGAVNRIDIEWQQRGDIGGMVDASQLGSAVSPCHRASTNLCTATTWGTAPALLEAQFILPGSTFTLASLSASNTAGQTMTLRPWSVGALTSTANWQPRYTPDSPNTAGLQNTPFAARCTTAAVSPYATGGYACRASITGLAIPARSTVSFLRMSAQYRGAALKVTLYNGATQVDFDGIQPEVDSTGRANDVFRRISSRLEMGNDNAFPLPLNAVDLGGSLCKDFGVTTTGVSTPSSCTP